MHLSALLVALASFAPPPALSRQGPSPPSGSPVPVERVIDGDTLVLVGGERVRLDGIDAPEPGGRARCDLERVRGREARRVLEDLVLEGGVVLRRWGTGKWRRTVASAATPDGEDVIAVLLAADLARPWTGRGAKPDWCDEAG